MSSKKGGDMALINFMVFLMLFLFGLICLLAALGGPNGYYDDEDDEEQEQFLMSWKKDQDEKTKKR